MQKTDTSAKTVGRVVRRCFTWGEREQKRTEDENHADEKTRLLSSASDTSVADNTDSKTGRQTCKTD